MEQDAASALDGLRVLDLSRVLAGPLCTQMLADHGAIVTKVEPPAGDDTRRWGPPFVRDGTSAYYTGLNRNKQNVALDLQKPAGREVLDRLLCNADVLVENFKPGTLDRWGFSDASLEQRFPAMVRCRITGFGTDGPLGGLAGYDAVLQAYGGLMSVNGTPDGPPLRVGVPVVDMVTGILAFSGILLALHERERSGRGQLVDCTLLDTAVALLHPHAASWFADGKVPERTGSAHPTIAPYESFTTRNGAFFLAAGNDAQFQVLAEVLDRRELAANPRFRTNEDRVRNVVALRTLLAAAIAEHDRDELAGELLRRGVPAAPVQDVGEALTSPQVLHRAMVVEAAGYRGTGVPVSLGRTPGRLRSAPGDHGQDTRDVLVNLGYQPEQVDELIRLGVANSPPRPS
jgi:crotonobetainyl-CoA:carnitine CoA-transferase CaiB-like acyl-CoA transferase